MKYISKALLIILMTSCIALKDSSLRAQETQLFEPTWESLKTHEVPKWFLDAKFVDNDSPDLMWFDNKMWIIQEEKRKEMAAYFYNSGIQNDKGLFFTKPEKRPCDHAIVFEITTGKPTDKEKDPENSLWYEKPATRWIESLPIGNGRLGAVSFGGPHEEQIGLNLSTLWSGEPSEEHEKKTGAENLDKIRNLIFNGELKQAEILCEEHLLGNKLNYGTHLPMGNLFLDFELESKKINDYQRSLDLQTALASTSYKSGGVQYSREVFASHPDDVIVIKLSANKAGQLNFKLHYDSQGMPVQTSTPNQETFAIEGDAFEAIHSDGKSGVHFRIAISVKDCDGKYFISENGIRVEDASSVVLLVSAGSNYKSRPISVVNQALKKASSFSYTDLKNRHIGDYRKLYKRAGLTLSGKHSNLPTDQQIQLIRTANEDPSVHALFYNYARYLLIASSREDSPLPGNLQGIWNDNFACKMPWTCDFHLDINTQQNYWMAESGNLTECHEPLFKLIEGMVEPGRRTADVLYGQPGWVAHVFTNAWGFTAPGWGLGWGLHVSGGIWIASHLWQHYLFTLDEKFLNDRAYPVLKEAAIFFSKYLVKHPDLGYLVSGPSVSPENKYRDDSGVASSETMGAVCDAVLIKDLFESCISTSKILGVDKDFSNKLELKLNQLQPLMVGEHGQLQEWLHDYEEAVPNHRHTSHLIALHPSSQITVQKSPELAKAAEVSIDRRLGQPDWEDVEWSRGNLINFYARLQKGEKALHHLNGLITDNAGISLLTYSRGGIAGAQQDIFVVDGNFAGAAGISEMLIQSFDGEIYLFPALPESWDQGEFKGVCTHGGFEIDLIWKNSDLNQVKVYSKKGQKLNLNHQGKRISINTKVGETLLFDSRLKVIK